jgi:hypothetical protein
MESVVENIVGLKRHLNSIEHMIYVSCKFTKTTEMLKKVMENIILGYEMYFNIAYKLYVGEGNEITSVNPHQHKIQMLNEALAARGIFVDLSDYFLLKRLMISDYDSIGQYRKNLSMIFFVDGEEYIINLNAILRFYENLRNITDTLKIER